MDKTNFLSKKTKRKNDKNMANYTKVGNLKYDIKNKIIEKQKKSKVKSSQNKSNINNSKKEKIKNTNKNKE